MEDALVPKRYSNPSTHGVSVLILVVMEDALVPKSMVSVSNNESLNPCCNGRCTRTMKQFGYYVVADEQS